MDFEFDEEINEKQKKRLEKIAKNYNGGGKFHTKALWFLPAVLVGGAVPKKYQLWFLDRLGWENKDPAILTKLNIPLGLGMSLVYYYGSEAALNGLSQVITSGVADVLNITAKAVIQGYGIYNAGQSLFRAGYVAKTKQPIMSFSLEGLLLSVGFSTGGKIKDKFINP
ncbi:MAG: hypothetical protein KKF48_04275 [Nanoarchaeota archaeon]|nr:hypothetical protein [Nanoarchaeota archaeon]MBU1028235.1 hypothetical protein [Nanoarchaeota archaeon]